MDVLAYIASDPTVLPLWAAFLFAAGMYPIGLIFGCSPCCEPCNVCEEGSLPETLTVTVEGYEDTTQQGPFITSLQFDSCWDTLPEPYTPSKPAGRITAPGGTPGPITATEITDGGSRYAILGREAPTLTITGGSGTGAVFSAVLDESTIGCEIPVWSLESATVEDGGSGYADNESATITAAVGDTVVLEAEASIRTVFEPPTVTVAATGAGTGASLTATLREKTGLPSYQHKEWEIDTISIVDGGSGYEEYDALDFTVDVGEGGALAVVSVDGSGVIVSVAIVNRGTFFYDTGVVESLYVYTAGEYYRENAALPAIVAPIDVTVIQSALSPSVGTGAELQANVDDDPDSPTFGQVVSITVLDGGANYLAYEYVPAACCKEYHNGKTYVLRRAKSQGDQLFHVLGGMSGPCRYEQAFCGVYGSGALWYPSAGLTGLNGIEVVYNGPAVPPTVRIQDAETPGLAGCNRTLVSTTLIENCSEFSFTATNSADDVTATVTPGGTYDPTFGAGMENEPHIFTGYNRRCAPCCHGDDTPPDEIEIDLSAADGPFVEPVTFVLSQVIGTTWTFSPPATIGGPNFFFAFIDPPGVYFANLGISVSVEPCQFTGCEHCWMKCRTSVGIAYVLGAQTGTGGSGSVSVLYSNALDCDDCDDTTETGICEPKPGTYTLTTDEPYSYIDDGNPTGEWTIEIK
jgi:hypothetical protein